MVNKTLFKTKRNSVLPANVVNAAGGVAYSLSDEHALCQYVVTGTFNGVFYASAGEQLEKVQTLVKGVDSVLIAQAAVYGHQTAKMKDVPAYLLAVLAARQETELLAQVFDRIVTNMKMLCNFVQIMRSGVTGRKSFGTSIKKLIQNWLVSRDEDELFAMSIGHADPSFADIVKMVHPHPRTKKQEALFAYLIGREYNKRNLPALVKSFEAFKADNTKPVPEMPFRALTNCGLTTEHWSELAKTMTWNTLRMNINTLARNGVFADEKLTKQLAAKLADADTVRRSNAFPYQLLTTFQNVQDAPMAITNALQDALEIAVQNVPTLNGRVAVCIDLSGSMSSAITGNRGSVTSKTRCIDVATLMAAAFQKTNPECKLIGWASNVGEVRLNPKDSLMTNAQKFAQEAYRFGGGTNAQLALQLLNSQQWAGDVVIYVSDNQSWIRNPMGTYGYFQSGTGMAHEWAGFKKRNPKAKLVCVDIQPYGDAQVPDSKDVMNVGGFSDEIWTVIRDFVQNSGVDFVKAVKTVEL